MSGFTEPAENSSPLLASLSSSAPPQVIQLSNVVNKVIVVASSPHSLSLSLNRPDPLSVLANRLRQLVESRSRWYRGFGNWSLRHGEVLFELIRACCEPLRCCCRSWVAVDRLKLRLGVVRVGF
ncbi:hypothetical protein Droror1_Dr00000520 [Drosera rotundifolia]